MATKSIMYNGEEFTYVTSDKIKIDFDGTTKERADRFIKYLMSIGIDQWDIRFAPFQGVDRFHYGVIVF